MGLNKFSDAGINRAYNAENMTHKTLFKVAILLPIMNEKDTLKRCLTSLVNQSCKDVAIIIQDNFSDDGSDQIISLFKNTYPNIFVNTSKMRVDSWENWDQLLQYAEKFFEFEYIFWIGGDDYLLENDYLENLYIKGVKNNLNIVTPTINIIEGKNGIFKNRVNIKLQSKFKLFRIIKYANNWENVNILHSLIRKSLYQDIIRKANGSHTNYVANDWWFGVSLIKRNRLESTSNVHFCKSQWESRRYSWIEGATLEVIAFSGYARYRKFIRHLFQDFEILRKHILRPHPLRSHLSSYEISVIVSFFSVKAIIRPPFIIGKWFFVKCNSFLRKPITSRPTIN